MNSESKEQIRSFEVREATPEDADDIARVQRDTWLFTYPNEEAGITREDLEQKFQNIEIRSDRWRHRIEEQSTGDGIFIIKEGKNIIGFCYAKKTEERHDIEALYLDPAFHGQGAGRVIFEKALAWLGDERPITLSVASYNDQAINFYKKFDFVEIGQGVPLTISETKAMPLTVMQKA